MQLLVYAVHRVGQAKRGGGGQRGGGDNGVGRGPERRRGQWCGEEGSSEEVGVWRGGDSGMGRGQWCGEEGTVVWGGGDSGMGRRGQWYGEKMHNENITAGAG